MIKDSQPTIPFIRLEGASLATRSSDDFGSLLAGCLPVNVSSLDHPRQDRPFFNQAGFLRLAELTILSTWGSAIQADVEQHREAQLVIPYFNGQHHYRLDQRHFHFQDACLLIPAARQRVRLHSTICAATVISFPPESLLPTAFAIAGPGFDGLALRSALEQPALLDPRTDPRRAKVHSLLIEALKYTDRALSLIGEVNPMLRLDDLIRRLIVLLLLPDLLDSSQAPAPIEEPFVHASLVEWLLAHLDEPLSLSDVERRSCYSRRSLQVAFKRRFGCGPMQWLRQQRLAKARALLESPAGCRSIAAVAQACGYLSVASFSRDFRARYGERPSSVMRRSQDRAQQSQPSTQSD